MSDELERLRKVKRLAEDLVRLDDQRNSIMMTGSVSDYPAVNARFHAAWTTLRQELAA